MYNLRKIREEKGFSQQKVCDELKKYGYFISRSTYTKYETGARALPCNILIGLAKCFDKSSDEILGIK